MVHFAPRERHLRCAAHGSLHGFRVRVVVHEAKERDFFDIAEMRRRIAAFSWRASFGHVLHHDVASRKSPNQKGTLISDHGPHPIVGTERVGGGAGACFLTESEVDAADYFALLIEILKSRFQRTMFRS